MKNWKKKLSPTLFALAGVLFLVLVMKDVIQGEPVRTVFLVLAIMFFVLAVVLSAKSRKADAGPRPPSA